MEAMIESPRMKYPTRRRTQETEPAESGAEINFLAIQDALRSLRSVCGQLAEIEALHGRGGSVEASEFFFRNEGHKRALTMLEEIDETVRSSFDALFHSCIWLPHSSVDMVIELASEAARKLSAAYVAMVEDMAALVALENAGQSIIDALLGIVGRSLRSLAECIRWNVIGYQEIERETVEAVSRCYLAAKKVAPWYLSSQDETGSCLCSQESIGAEYLHCRLLQNINFGALERSEMVKVCLLARESALSIPLRDEPCKKLPSVSINDENGGFSLVTSEAKDRKGALYFEYGHLHDFFSELDKALDVIHHERCHRWLLNLVRKLSLLCYSPREYDRRPMSEPCQFTMNYLPVVEQLRGNQLQSNGITSGCQGTVTNISDGGCCILHRVTGYQRPAIGRLVLLVSPSLGKRVGIVRWIRMMGNLRKKAKVGIEFIGASPEVRPAKAGSQWPNGLYVQNVICLNNTPPGEAGRSAPNRLQMIQPIGSHLSARAIDVGGHDERIYRVAELSERGMDFEVVSCR